MVRLKPENWVNIVIKILAMQVLPHVPLSSKHSSTVSMLRSSSLSGFLEVLFRQLIKEDPVQGTRTKLNGDASQGLHKAMLQCRQRLPVL